MKIHSKLFIAAAGIYVTALTSTAAYAQKEKGQHTATVGVGYSLVGALFYATSKVDKGLSNVNITSVPVLNAMYDYGVSDKFSLGAAASYQSITARYTDFVYENDNGVEVKETFRDRITRTNVGLRPLFHFGTNENLDMYTGMRFSFTFWNYTTTAINGWNDGGNFTSGRPKLQVLFGGRYFFTPAVGINMEAAIGPSYFAHIGASFRF